MKTEHVCPHCRNKTITRSLPKDARDRLMLMFTGKRPYRCLDCNHRFYDRPRSKQ